MGLTLVVALGGCLSLGCQSTPPSRAESPAPLRMPSPDPEANKTYEECLTGGQVFNMYCNQCHNAKSLAERPFANYQNAAAHMRVRANLTGDEYDKLVDFLTRFHDVSSPRNLGPSPKRPVFSQPIAELRDEAPGPGGLAPAAEAARPAP
jgi:hypothetical protein